MSTPPPAPPPSRPTQAGKPPPSWWWFVGPVVLLALAGVLFVVLLVTTVSDVSQVDARVPADGEPYPVTVPTDGERMLFADSSDDRKPCVVTTADGSEIEQRDVFGDFSMSRDGEQWSGLTRFDPGDGRIVVRCPRDPLSPAGEVLVTPAHDVSSFVARLLLTVFAPMILGGIGLLWAIVLGILVLTRRGR